MSSLSAANNSPCVGSEYDRNDVGGDGQIILAALVLYQMEASSSPALMSFVQALAETGLARRFRLLIYDNSPSRSSVPDAMPLPVWYILDPANGGLTAAYDAALRLAEKEGHEWLLLLDQDTVINAGYLKELWRCMFELAGNRQCVALAPRLLAENEIISPARVLWGGRLLPVDNTASGIAPWEIMALNSGTLLRVSAVRELGGFNPEFWLDYLDHWIFNRLHHAGYLFYVLDAELQHSLSVKNMAEMPLARYKNILLAEGRFYQCCKSPLENLIYGLRLLVRGFRMLILPGGRRFFWPVLAHLARHLRLKWPALAKGSEK